MPLRKKKTLRTRGLVSQITAGYRYFHAEKIIWDLNCDVLYLRISDLLHSIM